MDLWAKRRLTPTSSKRLSNFSFVTDFHHILQIENENIYIQNITKFENAQSMNGFEQSFFEFIERFTKTVLFHGFTNIDIDLWLLLKLQNKLNDYLAWRIWNKLFFWVELSLFEYRVLFQLSHLLHSVVKSWHETLFVLFNWERTFVSLVLKFDHLSKLVSFIFWQSPFLIHQPKHCLNWTDKRH
jgi:hypothetical protein